MKHFRRRSIQSLLISYFGVFAFLLLAIVSGIFSWMQYRYARSDAANSLRQTSVAVADSVDQQINQMSQITLGAISSTSMQDAFTSYLSGSTSPYERNQHRTRLAGLLTSARGLDFSIRQLNVYAALSHGEETYGYGVGEYNGPLPVSVITLPWYEAAREAGGRLIITGPAGNVYDGYASVLPSIPSRPEDTYIMVCRMFYNNLHVPIGFVEVRKFYRDVFSLASSPELSRDTAIYVYDGSGHLLYPAAPSGSAVENEVFDYFSFAGEGEQSIQNTLTGKREYVSFSVSPSCGLVVAAVTPATAVSASIYRSMSWIIAAFIILFVVALLVSLLFSRQISSPIRTIYHFLSDEKKDRFEPLILEETGIREIDKLTHSINDNIHSTKTATDTLMTLKEQELQAQMLALQSQMNPHFLYNSLSTIGEMAEEGLTQPVSEMCSQITQILRYISSNREQRSSLEEELEICDMYLSCIRMRYGDQLISRITVPDEMLEIQIPKLCIQLLVENAIRSVTTAAPPWEITVECSPASLRGVSPDAAPSSGEETDAWQVTVRDNGPGFDPEVEKRLRSQMEYILENGVLPSLKIQGMGILNIFIRLYLLDGIPFIFDMGNNPEGGAYVTIGGRSHT